MDYDINNQPMLQAGAVAQRDMRQSQDWRPINSAPRDGTVIEVRNTWGVAPTYQLVRWTDEMTAINFNSGVRVPFKAQTPSWVAVDPNAGGSPAGEGSWLMWRPYSGDISKYVDPTGGAQMSPAYWRGAVAAKYGLPLDYFEKEPARKSSHSEQPKKNGFWSWLFGGE